MNIDRCYCYSKPFAALHRVAQTTGAETVAALQAHAEFGHNCKLCHPYIRRMLRTGETAFPYIITEADEPEPQRC